MADYKHDHPGQKEPRAHGETHHENRIVDLNDARPHLRFLGSRWNLPALFLTRLGTRCKRSDRCGPLYSG